MYNSRVFLGSVAVMTAIGCVLSPSTFAIGANDGFIEQPQRFAQCCSAVDRGSLTAEDRTGLLVNGQAESAAILAHTVSFRQNSSKNAPADGNQELRGESNLGELANSFTRVTPNDYRDRKGNGLSADRGAKTLHFDNTKLVGAEVTTEGGATESGTTDTGATDGSKTASETPDVPDTKIDAGTDAAPTDPSGSEFTGSPEPAGGDLDPNAEKNLISSGWK